MVPWCSPQVLWATFLHLRSSQGTISAPQILPLRLLQIHEFSIIPIFQSWIRPGPNNPQFQETKLLFDEFIFCLQRLYCIPFHLDMPFNDSILEEITTVEVYKKREHCQNCACTRTPTSGSEVKTMTLQWHYHDITMTLQWHYHDNTMTLPWHYNDITMT